MKAYNAMEKEKYQVIYLHLSDGRTLKATVPAFCKEGDKLYIHPQFEVTEPQEMPEDCYWSIMPSQTNSPPNNAN